MCVYIYIYLGGGYVCKTLLCALMRCAVEIVQNDWFS